MCLFLQQDIPQPRERHHYHQKVRVNISYGKAKPTLLHIITDITGNQAGKEVKVFNPLGYKLIWGFGCGLKFQIKNS